MAFLDTLKEGFDAVGQQLSGFSSKINKQPDNVETIPSGRDVLKQFGTLLKENNPFSLAAKVGSRITQEVTGQPAYKPANKIEEFIFGTSEPIQPFKQEGANIAKGFGASEQTASSLGLPLGLAMGALDVLPLGGGKKKLVETIAGSTDEAFIKNALLKEVKNISEEEATRFASKLAPITDKKLVEAELSSFKPGSVAPVIESPLLSEARKSLNDVWEKANQTKSQLTSIWNEANKITEPTVRERSFARGLQESPAIAPEVKAGLKNTTYNVEHLPDAINTARTLVSENVDEAFKIFKGTNQVENANRTALGVELIKSLQSEKKFAEAVEVADMLSEKLTKAGQEANAAKVLYNMDPESILYKTTKIAKQNGFQEKLTADLAERVTELANNMKTAVTPEAKIESANEIQMVWNSLTRSSVGKKLSSAQTIAQLLNPKTWVRNLVGNELFFRLERFNNMVSAPIDWTLTKLIPGKEREIVFGVPKQGTFWNNFLTGWRSQWRGVAPEGIKTQFELYAPVFQSKWNPLTYMEQTLRAGIGGFDYAAFKRAKDTTIGELGYLRAKNEGLTGKELITRAKEYAAQADDNIIQIATDYGKYVTFQDENALSMSLQKIKKALNFGKEFGLGDLVLKYPRTPGALLMRALEYSPAGFLKSAYELKQALTTTPFRLKEFELSLSRAITGSLGLTGMGYFLYDKGIITGSTSKDTDVRNLETQSGKAQYQVNISALRRFITSGFDPESTEVKPGDKLYTYDWVQPVAIAISIGANMNKNVKEAQSIGEDKSITGGLSGTLDTALASLEGGINTIQEQPVVTGLKRLFGSGGGIGPAVVGVLESLPTSFTPTLLNQLRQATDETKRVTYDPSFLNRVVNGVKNKLPGLSRTLPEQYGTLGVANKVMQDPNLLNIFLNPGFTSTYKPTPVAAMVLDLYNKTGETKQFPRTAPKQVTILGRSIPLNNDQVSKFQKNIGEATDIIFAGLAEDYDFIEAEDDETRVNMLNTALTKIWTIAKYQILNKEQRRNLVNALDETEKEKLISEFEKYLHEFQ